MSVLFAILKWGLGLAAALWLTVTALLTIFQSRLLYQPTRDVFAVPTDVGLAYEHLWLTSSNGHENPAPRIEAWFIPAASEMRHGGKLGGQGSVLFCHGNGGNLSHRLETAMILHRLGMNVLLFDYQGYGNSEGKPSESATYADAATCWNWLVNECGEQPERIVLMGRSLGGAVAAQLAETATPHPAGLVLESTFTSVPDMGARMYPFLPVRLLARHRYDTRARLDALASIQLPLLVIHSPEDDIVPYSLGRDLFDHYSGPKAFHEIQGSHNEGFLLTGPAYDDALQRFFADILPNEFALSETADPLSN